MDSNVSLNMIYSFTSDSVDRTIWCWMCLTRQQIYQFLSHSSMERMDEEKNAFASLRHHSNLNSISTFDVNICRRTAYNRKMQMINLSLKMISCPLAAALIHCLYYLHRRLPTVKRATRATYICHWVARPLGMVNGL